jgi:Flp pilus assembly protein TadG
MVKTAVRTKERERGQAVMLVILSMSIFLFGALGMAIDGSQLYAQRQMAQVAADAAAQAGIVTIFNGSTAIGTSAYYCTSANTTSPCTYASKNNFTAGATACTSGADATPGNDCIKVDPNPGVTITGLDPGTPNELQITITRAVSMTVLKMVGLNSFKVTARATCAIVDIITPVPILITQPWKSGSLDFSGTGSVNKIRITGGPQRSIQVNSSNSTSMTWNGNPGVDLSTAGPFGTGADFGDFGGPSSGGSVLTNAGALGSTEHFIQPADPIDDPLASVPYPTGIANAHAPMPLANGVAGCPASPAKSCELYFPGVYSDTNIGDISVQNQTAVFAPGIYYMTATMSGATGAAFSNHSNGVVQMATGLTDSSTSVSVTTNASTPPQVTAVTSCCGTNQGWNGTQAGGGVMFFFTGPAATVASLGCTPAVTPAARVGAINLGANSDVSLIGSPTSGTYKGMLFFVDRSAATQNDNLGGGGNLTLFGTIYMTDTIAQMGQTSAATCSQNQIVAMGGNSGSTTTITGEIIVSMLNLDGTSGINMTLSPLSLVTIRQIALVNGE